MKNSKNVVSQEDIIKILDAIYEKSISGIDKVSIPVGKMAEDYLSKYNDKDEAVRSMLNAQIAKCTTSGFITGFGGAITLPLSIPANIGSVLYVQMRMIACTANMAGYDLKSDQVQTLVYACLAGVSVNEIFKKAGIKFGEKLTQTLIKKIPGEVLTKLNQKVGFRFITKAGETGIINLTKLIPGVGAVVNGGLDLVETKIIADRAYKWFFKGDLSTDKNLDGQRIIDVDVVEVDVLGEEE